jgi:hypothetical protein
MEGESRECQPDFTSIQAHRRSIEVALEIREITVNAADPHHCRA